MAASDQKVLEYTTDICSPVEIEGSLFLVSKNGDYLSLQDNELKQDFHYGGQPSSLVYDNKNKIYYFGDLAHQAIISRSTDEKGTDTYIELFKEYESQPFLGPNTLILSENQKINFLKCYFFNKLDDLFFTDSGPFGETSVETSKVLQIKKKLLIRFILQGSVFLIDIQERYLRPLALGCLAFPSGLALVHSGKILQRSLNKMSSKEIYFYFSRYVCQTGQNRILRFVLTSQGSWHFSVFRNFKGRFGPVSCVVNNSDLLYVARYQISSNSEQGIIDVINPRGEIQETIQLQGYPQITGLFLSKIKTNLLYVTDNTNQASLIKVTLKNEDQDENQPTKKEANSSYR